MNWIVVYGEDRRRLVYWDMNEHRREPVIGSEV